MQDASALGGPVAESGLGLDLAARALRDLSVSLSGHVNTLSQPSVPSQDLIELGATGRLAWRFFDCLSPLLEAEAGQWKGAHTAGLDSTALKYAGGLRADLWDWGFIEALGQAGAEAYPNTDLDATTQGGEARLDVDLPGDLRWRSRAQRLTRAFTERRDYTATGLTGTNLRSDQELNWETGLTWAPTDGSFGSEALLRGHRLDSNGQSIDYGPGQNQYRDVFIPTGTFGVFINDDTLNKDYFSQQSIGGGLRLWWQTETWGLVARAGSDDVQFLGRVAKGADDKFLAGAPLRHDRVLQGGLRLSVPFGSLGLDWMLALDWSTWGASSNDSIYTYQRNLSTAALSLLF